jgi:hypothetical protein
LLIMVSALSCIRTSQKSPWHHPLYMANNDYWRQRIPVTIRNNTSREIPGEPIELQIGINRGQVPLNGALAEAVRVTTSRGEELMFRISDPDGKIVEKGAITGNSKITIPVECKADTIATNYIYFDNPSAWAVGDYLKTNSKPNDSIIATVLKKEKLSLNESGKTDKWFGDNTTDQNIWRSRAAVKTMNYGHQKISGKVVCVGIEGVLNRLHAEVNKNPAIQVTDGIKSIPFYRMGKNILFNQDIQGLSEQTNYIYFSSEENQNVTNVTNLNDLGKNLLHNPDFESRDLSEWKAFSGTENIKVSEESKEGSGSVQLQITTGEAVKEAGLEQTTPVQAARLYLFSAWIKCSDMLEQPDFNRGIRERTLRAQFISKDGKAVGRLSRIAVNPDVHIDNAWSQLFMLINTPEGADSVRLQLVNSAPGTVWFDNVTFMEAVSGETSPLAIERKASKDLKELTVWQEDPIVKVFQDDLPGKTLSEAFISVALNEAEPLQLVIRSPKDYKQLQIKVNPPVDSKGNKLEKISIGVLGYVPVNYPSNYIVDRVSPAWRQKIPFGNYGSDGWVGMWPDPILPFQSFNLSAFSTQPLWIEYKVPKNAVPGDYTGNVQLIHIGEVIKEIPVKVRVRNFELPDRPHMTAEYDVRSRSDSAKKAVWKVLAEHRLAPDHILPAPTWKNVNGKIIFDFTEYDKAAVYFFDSLKFSRTYAPQLFYLFGWANPPGNKFGEKPYEENSPYSDVDRSKLRPEFKKAYQSAIRNYWNHMKAKGWADKVVFYVSDEPHALPEITAQMRALCDMIHEVDRKIPIYVSCWSYRPEYIGYIDVWGVSNHRGPVEDLIKIKKTGDRLFYTTDGKMCTDTPYLGFERMLPYFCFKYGAEEYEFWASDWFTLNPYDYGWHSFIRESQVPGVYTWTRYPNGDGYLVYPGQTIGVNSLVASIRLKLAREGVEDFEYLYLLDSLIKSGKKLGKDVSEAEKAIESAKALVTIPSDEGRYSTRNLPDPYAVLRVREQIAEAIEGLLK